MGNWLDGFSNPPPPLFKATKDAFGPVKVEAGSTFGRKLTPCLGIH